MFGSTVLEIVIILVFIYLIYSLLATIFVEAFASIFRLRARSLRWGIIRMLQDDEKKNVFLGFIDSIARGFIKLFKRNAYEKDFVQAFFNRPSIKYLGKNNTQSTPSYLEPEVFSKAVMDIFRQEEGATDIERIKKAIGFNDLMDRKVSVSEEDWNTFKEAFDAAKTEEEKNELLADWEGRFSISEPTPQIELNAGKINELIQGRGKSSEDNKFAEWKKWITEQNGPIQIDQETREHLCTLLRDANEDAETFRLNLENWFDLSMDRVKGWYKKKISLITFFFGLFVAISLNVDTIEIVKKLKDSTALREALVVEAEAFAAAHDDVQMTATDSETGIEKDSIAIANLKADVESAHMGINDAFALGDTCSYFSERNFWGKLFAIFGWLITAFAISFGGPFWFDLLNKLISLRSSIQVKQSGKKEPDEGESSVKGRKVRRGIKIRG